LNEKDQVIVFKGLLRDKIRLHSDLLKTKDTEGIEKIIKLLVDEQLLNKEEIITILQDDS
jgi:hypothetical protein